MLVVFRGPAVSIFQMSVVAICFTLHDKMQVGVNWKYQISE